MTSNRCSAARARAAGSADGARLSVGDRAFGKVQALVDGETLAT